jgi:hypothetical protein
MILRVSNQLVLRVTGYIAQWLERLTADQQVPGSNPGVPFFHSRLQVSAQAFMVVVPDKEMHPTKQAVALAKNAETRDRTGDLQIFSLTLSQLSYRGLGEQHCDFTSWRGVRSSGPGSTAVALPQRPFLPKESNPHPKRPA